MASVVIAAAGSSTRFGENKMLSDIGGKPMIVRTVQLFADCDRVDEIIVAARAQDIPFYEELFKSHGLSVKVVEGGSERIISICNGAKAAQNEIILTHDGARPLTPLWLIEDLITAVEQHHAAMTAITPTATIKCAEGDLIIQKSLPRQSTWIAQTPQGFKRGILLNALQTAIDEKYFLATDDSEIVALYGHKVKIVPGDPINIKVTVKSDLAIANALFQ